MDYQRFGLVIWPDPILEKKTDPVTAFDENLKKFSDYMFEMMNKHDGIGLAAPQIGVSKSIFVIQIGEYKEVFINPQFTVLPNSETVSTKEGCLSFPGVIVETKRGNSIKVQYQDLDGKHKEALLHGLMAIAFQHENDHLDGQTFLRYASGLRRRILKERAASAKRRSQ